MNKGTEISFSPLGLQTILFALSGSGSFIFALGGIEFIGYLEAEALEIPVDFQRCEKPEERGTDPFRL